MPHRVAVIDIGSNSIKILVAEGREVKPLFEKTLDVRLSPAADEPQDEISVRAMEAGVGAVSALLPEADLRGVDRIAVVATSMVREAKNGAEFADAIEEATGERLRILTGKQEAEGIAAGIATDPELAGQPRLGVFDLGGGSLEFIHRADGRVRTAISHPVGAVRITRRFVSRPELPVPAAELAAVRAEVHRLFAGPVAEALKAGTLPLAGCGGAFTAIRAITGARAGVSAKESPAFIPVALIESLMAELAAKPVADRIAVAGVPPARADILPTAFATLLEVAGLAGADGFTHSWRNLRYGIAAGMLAGK